MVFFHSPCFCARRDLFSFFLRVSQPTYKDSGVLKEAEDWKGWLECWLVAVDNAMFCMFYRQRKNYATRSVTQCPEAKSFCLGSFQLCM